MRWLIVCSIVANLGIWPAVASADYETELPFRVDSGVSGAYAPGISGYGFSGLAEPKLNITNRLSAGLRAEGAIMLGGNIDGSDEVSVSTNVAVATLLKGEYFITGGNVRPFVGLGAGMYTFVGQGVSVSGGASVSQQAGRYFGVAPQLGVNFGGFRLAATYNIPLNADIIVTQSVSAGGGEVKLSRDYATLEFSFRWGGRRGILQPAPATGEPGPPEGMEEGGDTGDEGAGEGATEGGEDESADAGMSDETSGDGEAATETEAMETEAAETETAETETTESKTTESEATETETAHSGDQTTETEGTDVAMADSGSEAPPAAAKKALPASIDPRGDMELASLDQKALQAKLGAPAASKDNVLSFKSPAAMPGVRAVRFHYDANNKVTRIDAWLAKPVSRADFEADLGKPDRTKDTDKRAVLIYTKLKMAAYATKDTNQIVSLQLRL